MSKAGGGIDMPVKFFGQYLLEKRVITRDELLAAVEFQEAQNLKLGEYAVRLGFISAEEANRVNLRQQTEDERFGEAAMALGLLTPAQIDELITLQRNNHVYLGEAVVRTGFATEDAVEEALTEFQETQRKYQTTGVDLEGLGLREPSVFSTCFELTQKLLLRVWDVNSKLGEPVTKAGVIKLNGHVVQIALSGQFSTRFILSADPNIIARGALKLLQEEWPDEEMRDDLLREFANVVCGNIVALLAKRGKSCDIAPPVTIGNEVQLGPEKSISLAFVTPDGDAALALTYS